jgi:hypothetical protein
VLTQNVASACIRVLILADNRRSLTMSMLMMLKFNAVMAGSDLMDCPRTGPTVRARFPSEGTNVGEREPLSHYA